MRAFQITNLLLLTAIIVGCDRRQQVNLALPTSAPATTNSADTDGDPTADLVIAATSRPAVPAAIQVDRREYDFPPVQILLRAGDGGVIGTLISEDPPNAADPDYSGNSVYLQMELTIPESKTLAGAKWDFQTASTEREDEINGIYLDGQRRALQPFDVHAEILGDVSPVKIGLKGTFLLFDEESAEAKPVEVAAQITAQVKVQTRGK